MPIRDTIRWAVHLGSPSGRNIPDSRFERLLTVARSREHELWFVAIGATLINVALTVHGLTLGLSALRAGALAVGGCCRLLVRDRYGAVVPISLGLLSLCAVVVSTAVIGHVII